MSIRTFCDRHPSTELSSSVGFKLSIQIKPNGDLDTLSYNKDICKVCNAELRQWLGQVYDKPMPVVPISEAGPEVVKP